MIYDENSEACITLTEERIKNKIETIISFYDNHPICDGDMRITKDDIYEIKNPYFLSDIFVFCKKHYNDVFLIGEVDIIPYIKVNSSNQIEEIGNDFKSRFHFEDYDALLNRNDVNKATNLHKIMFSLIGDEYWCSNIIKNK